jgi:integrase
VTADSPHSVFTPFARRFTDEKARDTQDTEELYRSVERKHRRSRYADPRSRISLSEVLWLTPAQINVGAGIIVIECLKKRRHGVFRAVPMPEHLLAELDRVHHLSAAGPPPDRVERRLWPWCRTTAWHYVMACMADAGITGPQASPKGLRHAFAVNALDVSVPLPLIQKWLGHSRLTTTAIYTNAVGTEERAIAARYWNAF